MFFVGVGGISMAATANTVVQLAVPDRLRGRVMSVYTTVFAGSTPIGGLVTGGIASAAGVPFAIGLGAVLSLGTGVLGITWLRNRPLPKLHHGTPAGAPTTPAIPTSGPSPAPTAARAARGGAPPSTGPG